MEETLSDELINGRPPSEANVKKYDINGLEIEIGVIKK